MLILTRKAGQQVLINNGSVKVEVLKVEGEHIYLGFNAPKDIDIDRAEIFVKKRIKERLLQQAAND